MSLFESWWQKLNTTFSSFCALLTEPSHTIDDPEQRRQARLLSGLLLVGLLSFGINALVSHGIWLAPIVLIILAYFLSRSRYYIWGIGIYTVVLAIPSFVSVVPVADQGMYRVFFALAWLMFPILLVGLVSSARNALGVTALLIAALIVLSRLIPALDMITLMPSLGFLWTLAGLISLATASRQWYSKRIVRNVHQLNEARSALQQAHDELERRVEVRTVELQQANEQLFQEVAERKQAQREADIARDQALEALKLKSRILANVSHDARTPLSVIMLRTEMMKRGSYGDLTDRQQEILDAILLSGKDLLDFIDNLLQESRLDSTQEVKPGKSEIVLADWLNEFIAVVRPLADHKGLTLKVELSDDLPAIVCSDPNWLRHILNNLVSNAIKFTDEGAVTIRAFRPDQNSWGLSVSDTGLGIPAEAQEHIFKAFWQVDGSTTRKTSRGVGLGLSIVNNLVRLLGGQAEVESQLGAGSTFRVILPLENEMAATISD